MAHNLKPKGAPDFLYEQDGSRSIFGVSSTRSTAPRVVLSNTPMVVKPWVRPWYSSQGYPSGECDKHIANLASRPVYAMRSSSGKIALLFGPPGATDEHPLDSLWFRSILHRPLTPILQSLASVSKADPFTCTMSQLAWANGGGSLEFSSGQANVSPAMLTEWRKRKMLGGAFAIYRGSAGHGTLKSRYVPSSGNFPPCLVYNTRFGNGVWNYNLALTPDNPIAPPSSSQVSSEAPWFLGNPNLAVTGQGVESLTVFTSVGSALPGFRMNPAYVLPTDDATVVSDASAVLGLTPVSPKAGSYFPFPFASTRLGYAVGLPTQMKFIVWEGTQVDCAEDGSSALELSVAFTDVTGEQYKALYPISSLPADKQAGVLAKFDELPGDIVYRVAIFPEGLNYGSVLYDQTTLAKDIARANSVLDDLYFDALEDDSPPIGYGSLGAKSLVAITKGRNIATAICLTTEGQGLADLTPIDFTVSGSQVLATQSGYAMTSGEAMIAIRSGAATTFTGITADAVATQFFLLPSWNDVIGFEANAQASSYLVDENVVSNELQFDLAGTDELARVLPLLLGFERNDFALTVGSLLVGVTSHIIAKA